LITLPLKKSNFIVRPIHRDEWEFHWTSISSSNLIQSWEFGEAKSFAEKWHPIRLLTETICGQPIALTQILTRPFPYIGYIARVNRGPLLLDIKLDPSSLDELYLLVLSCILHEAKMRRWNFLSLAPELSSNDSNKNKLNLLNLYSTHHNPWASTRLSLLQNQEALLAALNGKWRNLLRKAQKSKLQIKQLSKTNDSTKILIQNYNQLKKLKGFTGVSDSLLNQLSLQVGPKWCFTTFAAYTTATPFQSSELVGLLVSVVHGKTATYLIGTTTKSGRKLNANYLMLWDAILFAKSKGCSYYDLGGLNQNTASGIAHFKRGINGKPYELIGEYTYSPHFIINSFLTIKKYFVEIYRLFMR